MGARIICFVLIKPSWNPENERYRRAFAGHCALFRTWGAGFSAIGRRVRIFSGSEFLVLSTDNPAKTNVGAGERFHLGNVLDVFCSHR